MMIIRVYCTLLASMLTFTRRGFELLVARAGRNLFKCPLLAGI
jgi:hypothetical protein